MPHKHPLRISCILLLVVILGLFGVRELKPFHEGYWEYSGPGSMAGQIYWISRAIDAFKKDHGGKPPSPLGMWDILRGTSDSTELGDTPAKGTSCGPYLDFGMINRLNGCSAVADKPAPGVGWVYKVAGTDFTFSAVNAKGDAVLTEDEAHLYYFRPSERAHVASQRAWNNWGGLLFGIPLVLYLLAILVLRPSRRVRRRAQGLCEICGYDLRASTDRCSECGSPFVRTVTDRKKQ
ncbi:MAG TPA: hypothetical protein VGN88_06680 [Phycisphaerae bacterium]